MKKILSMSLILLVSCGKNTIEERVVYKDNKAHVVTDCYIYDYHMMKEFKCDEFTTGKNPSCTVFGNTYRNVYLRCE